MVFRLSFPSRSYNPQRVKKHTHQNIWPYISTIILPTLARSVNRVHGDVVWVQARAEEQVMALLEADKQMAGQESEIASQTNIAW